MRLLSMREMTIVIPDPDETLKFSAKFELPLSRYASIFLSIAGIKLKSSNNVCRMPPLYSAAAG